MGDLTKEQKAAIRAAIDKKKKDAERAANKTEGKKKPITSSPKKEKTPAGEFDPYGGLSEDELNTLLDESTPLRKSKVSGYQSEEVKGKGVFGAGVTVEEFKKRNPEWAAKFKKEYGVDFDPNVHAKRFQDEYNDHVEGLAKKRALEAGYDEKEAASLAKKFRTSQGFLEGKKVAGDPRYKDTQFGEFTSSRFEPIFRKKVTPKKPEEKVEVQPGPGVINPARQPFTKRGYIPPKTAAYAPWWMQDIVKTTGAANDLMRVKQYMPWQAEPEVYLPDATFYDPTRELAANAEQANIQTQGLAAFTGPQALSARSSAIQGQGAKNAADIMARYNNLNVGIANQLSGQRSDIMNTAAQNQANMDTQLWDKYTVANQQFDNAKNQARQHLRQSYIDAITNRAKTQALNTLYPNYYTDPSRGGFVNFKGDPNKIRANRPDFTNEYRDAFELAGSHAGAMDYLRYKKGMPATKGAYDGYGVGYDESANYLKNQKYPGPGASYNTTTEAE